MPRGGEVRIIGAKAHSARLHRMASPAQATRVGKALFKAGQSIEVTAEGLITAGSISGKGHVASAPGEPPNRDNGILDGNIETLMAGPLKVHVASNAPYARPLELGTSRMSARPYMKPAVAMKRDEVTQYIRQVVRNATQGD